MRIFPTMIGRVMVTAVALLFLGFISPAIAKKPVDRPPPGPPSCDTAQPDYVVFLDGYPKGRFYLAVLPCLSGAQVQVATPRELALDLPRKLRRTFQVGNGDVFNDGDRRRIVFGGRTDSRDHWGIYDGVIDVDRGIIRDIRALVSTPSVREEDPRFSSDGQWIVYKRNGEIWRVSTQDPFAVPELFHSEDGCELWAPSMYANAVTYARRCRGQPDRIVYHVEGTLPQALQSLGDGPDQFAHFTLTGDVVYSHFDTSENRSSLWLYNPGARPQLLHDETSSDDDPYAERDGNGYIAFGGWGDGRYDLYVFRRSVGNAVRITDNINVFGPILFE
jgi:hypothetical protein